jgi:RNA polymerase sigma-70 factor (ECF subfamily)
MGVSTVREQRLASLYADHAGRLYGYARRHGDAATAEDLVADAFVVAVRRPDEVPKEPGEAFAWLVGTVRKLAANRRRREATYAAWWAEAVRETWRGVSGASAEEVAAERDDCLRALAALSETDREALLLVAWEGLTPAQTAAVLGLSRNAFSVRLHRARGRLAHALTSDTTATVEA